MKTHGKKSMIIKQFWTIGICSIAVILLFITIISVLRDKDAIMENRTLKTQSAVSLSDKGDSAQDPSEIHLSQIEVKKPEKLPAFYNFLNTLLIFAIISCIEILICIVLHRIFHWRLNKLTLYTLMGTFVLIFLVSGFATRGTTILTSLYDGRTEGQLKVFTDFFDYILTGRDVYVAEKNIYPPLISAFCLILHHFIPVDTIHTGSVIELKNSQMGALLYIFFVLFISVLLFSVINRFYNHSKKERVAIFLLLCFSYPMIHCLERGNLTLIAVIALTIFLFWYDSDCYLKRQIAYISLAIAMGVKIYPVILGILLVIEKRWKDIINCTAYCMIINLLPSIFFSTGFSTIAYMLSNATLYVDGTAFTGGKIDLTHLLMSFTSLFHWSGDHSNLLRNIIIAFIICLTLVIIIWGNLKKWKLIMLLIAILVLLGSFSPFYYLLYFIGPMLMFLNEKENYQTSILYAFLFTGLFIPVPTYEKYVLAAYLPDQAVWHNTIISGLFLCLSIIVLLIDGMISVFNKKNNGKKQFVNP